MKDKKSLYLIASGLGLITTIMVAVFSTSNTSLFKSLAGGIVHTSDKGRTLTLDSTTPYIHRTLIHLISSASQFNIPVPKSFT